MDEPAGKNRSRKKGIRLKMAAGGVLVLALLGLGAWRIRAPVTYEPDPNAEPVAQGGTRSIGELKEELQSQADESSFRLQLNAKPLIKGDQAELLLGNPIENKLCLTVTIRLDEDGEILYESGTLVPGAQILTAQLNKVLPAGEYPATAVCTAIDQKTGESVGSPIQASLLLEAEESSAPAKESAAVPAKELASVPAKETAAAPAKETAAAPAKETAAAPAKETAAAPAKETAAVPAEKTVAAPAEETAAAPAEKIAAGPAEKTAAAPAEESAVAVPTEVTEAKAPAEVTAAAPAQTPLQ